MTSNNEIKYTEKILINESYILSLLSDIKSAKKSIDMEVYIFNDDLLGQKVSQALCDASHRGIKVRVLVDGIGTYNWGNKLTKTMDKAGVQTRIYHPLPWVSQQWNYSAHSSSYYYISNVFHWLFNINTRNHRKVCIVDKNIAYVGSANINDGVLLDDTNKLNWRDTSVRLGNINTNELQLAFEKAWNSNSLKKRIINIFSIKKFDPVFRLNDTFKRRRLLYKSMLNKIKTAKNIIWVTNAYFLPDNQLLKALVGVSKRGVDVRILLPNKSDVLVSSLASKTFYLSLLKHDVSIYEYLPAILHAKILIIDDWYCIGSSNLNFRSTLHDLEVDVKIQTKDAKNTLNKQFSIDIDNSKKIRFSDIAKQSSFKFILGYCALIIRRWL